MFGVRLGVGRGMRFGLGRFRVDFNRFWRGPRERYRVITGKELCFACLLWGVAQSRVRVPSAGPLRDAPVSLRHLSPSLSPPPAGF